MHKESLSCLKDCHKKNAPLLVLRWKKCNIPGMASSSRGTPNHPSALPRHNRHLTSNTTSGCAVDRCERESIPRAHL